MLLLLLLLFQTVPSSFKAKPDKTHSERGEEKNNKKAFFLSHAGSCCSLSAKEGGTAHGLITHTENCSSPTTSICLFEMLRFLITVAGECKRSCPGWLSKTLNKQKGKREE